jgi:acyl-CoA synthetase (AMP-forming)/AMP-acid ligase II
MDTSPLPILDAAEHFRGRFVDLDTARVISADKLRRTRAELERRFAADCVISGARIVVAVSNGPQFVATLLAILAAGGSPLLVHPKTPAAELKRTALRFGARLIMTDECPGTNLEPQSLALIRFGAGDWLELFAAHVDPATPGFRGDYFDLPGVPMHPTSGTTGEPKVALRPGFAAIEEARHYIETIGISAADTIMAVAPMCHAYAYGMCVMVPLLSGASVVSMRSFQTSRVYQGLAETPITILPGVPAMFDVLLFGAGDRLRSAMRTVLSAGSPLAERTADRFRTRTGITIRPLYGTTETGGITVAPVGEKQIAGTCVGPPMQGIDVQVRPDPAHTDPNSGMGRLFIHSSSMMAGYLGHDGIDQMPLVDGWFQTGDLARIDEFGHIHLVGREADVINVEGLKVIPSEVEETIAAVPGVIEVKVYAGSRKSGSQFIKAAIVVEPHVDLASIRSACERNLVYYKRPDRIIPLDALPRSAAGKIQKDQLP